MVSALLSSIILQQFVTSHTSGIKTEDMSEVELMSLDTRSYLDRTVVPVLLDAMAVVAKERLTTAPPPLS